MTQFASDAFAGVDGTELSAYNAQWARHPVSGANYAAIDSGRLRLASVVQAYYYHSASPESADYSVSADIAYISGNGAAALLARADSAIATYYMALLNISGGSASIFLYRVANGLFGVLGTASVGSIAVGASINVRIDVAGTAVKAYFGGSATSAVAATDSAIAAKGRAGLVAFTAGAALDNFSADQAGPQISANPASAALSIGASAPSLALVPGPASAALSIGASAPSLALVPGPASASISVGASAPALAVVASPASAQISINATAPNGPAITATPLADLRVSLRQRSVRVKALRRDLRVRRMA